VCYSVLQCVAVCCIVLQCVAVCCSVLQCKPAARRVSVSGTTNLSVCYSVLQCVAACCSVLQCAVCECLCKVRRICQCVTVCCSMLQCVAECCSALQSAVCCSVQCVAVCGARHSKPAAWQVSVYCKYGSLLHCATVCCTVLRCVAVRGTRPVCCSVLQCVVVCCSVL